MPVWHNLTSFHGSESKVAVINNRKTPGTPFSSSHNIFIPQLYDFFMLNLKRER